MTDLLGDDQVRRGVELVQRVRDGLNSTLLGQQQLVDSCVIALCARGHLLLEGLPGLGKTELVKALGSLLGLTFRRVQFTPDLLPGDITGGPILHEQDGQRQLQFQPGPLFANVVLADEINRASPKTQSALLEAMQERRVTVLGETHPLPDPFFVLATQNPIELEGTYPLPEAQLDRFLFKVEVPGVDSSVMAQILMDRRRGEPPAQDVALTGEELAELFGCVDAIFLPPAVANYIARLVGATHASSNECPAAMKEAVRFGASPRAAIAIAEAARAAALLAGRPNVDFADVQRVAVLALAHRLVLQHQAQLAGTTARQLVAELQEQLPVVGKPLPEVVQ